MISLHYVYISTLHYDLIILGCIPFHYANIIMLLYVYVSTETCLVYVCMY